MRSLRYLLGFGPHTVDDCLDAASRTQGPTTVTITPTCWDLPTDHALRRDYLARCRWSIGGREWERVVHCGATFIKGPSRCATRDADRANATLAGLVARLRHAGVIVHQSHPCFIQTDLASNCDAPATETAPC